MPAQRGEETPIEITELVLHVIKSGEVGVQTRLTEVTLAHRKVKGVAFHEAAISSLWHRRAVDRGPRVNSFLHAFFELGLYVLLRIHWVSAGALPGTDVRVDRAILFKDTLLQLVLHIFGRSSRDMERQDTALPDEACKEGKR